MTAAPRAARSGAVRAPSRPHSCACQRSGPQISQRNFRIAPLSGTSFETVGGDELLFVDGHSRGQPFVCVVTAPASPRGSADSRLSGARERAAAAADGPGVPLIPEVSLAAPSADAVARLAEHRSLVHAQRVRALPVPARPGAVLRRRLGNARRLPGPGRDAARAGARGADPRPAAARHEGSRTPMATGHSGSCSSSANAASAPAIRMATSCSGRCWCSPSICIASGDAGVLEEPVPFLRLRRASGRGAGDGWQHVQRALRSSRSESSRVPRSPPTVMATGTIHCSRPIRRCANRCAAPGP